MHSCFKRTIPPSMPELLAREPPQVYLCECSTYHVRLAPGFTKPSVFDTIVCDINIFFKIKWISVGSGVMACAKLGRTTTSSTHLCFVVIRVTNFYILHTMDFVVLPLLLRHTYSISICKLYIHHDALRLKQKSRRWNGNGQAGTGRGRFAASRTYPY